MEVSSGNRNAFLALASAQWHNGEDSEVIALNLAEALREIVREGAGEDADVLAQVVWFFRQLDTENNTLEG